MASPPSPFKIHSPQFRKILGPNPALELLLTHTSYPFAHEAGVYFSSTSELFITSNQFRPLFSLSKRVQITKIKLPNEKQQAGENQSTIIREEIPTSEEIPMANGGVNYGADGILFCGQGSLTKPSGLYHMSSTPPYTVSLLLCSFYGRPFNSVNDVVVHSDGSIWFTDPIYGHEQGYRPKPQLPGQVYRFEPESGSVRAMADGLGRPNGICFAPEEEVVYVTDTDAVHGDGSVNCGRVSSIYAFNITYPSSSPSQPFLTNKRLFAMAPNGIPDGIKCDMEGNVYSGCGDGVNVWSPGGVLLGVIKVEGGVANFCFGRGGVLFLLNEHKLWRARLGEEVRGALLGI